MDTCQLIGHRPEFSADGATMRWGCDRCGEPMGEKTYDTPERAQHYATALNRRDTEDLGRRAPLIGLLPLRIWRRLSGRSTR